MPNPKSLVDDPDLDWKKVKRRLQGVSDQITQQSKLVEDTRQAYCDGNDNPYPNCKKFVECQAMIIATLSLVDDVIEQSIEYLIEGDGD